MYRGGEPLPDPARAENFEKMAGLDGPAVWTTLGLPIACRHSREKAKFAWNFSKTKGDHLYISTTRDKTVTFILYFDFRMPLRGCNFITNSGCST